MRRSNDARRTSAQATKRAHGSVVIDAGPDNRVRPRAATPSPIDRGGCSCREGVTSAAGRRAARLLKPDIGSHAGAVTGEYPREHVSGCRPGLRQRRACRQEGGWESPHYRPRIVGVCDGAVVASCAYREWRERPWVTQLGVRGSLSQRLGGDADSLCSSGRCGREARREVPLCVARAVRRPEGRAASGRPRGRSLSVPRGSQVALATAPGRGSTVGSCSQHLLSVPPPPCSTRRLQGASASFRS